MAYGVWRFLGKRQESSSCSAMRRDAARWNVSEKRRAAPWHKNGGMEKRRNARSARKICRSHFLFSRKNLHVIRIFVSCDRWECTRICSPTTKMYMRSRACDMCAKMWGAKKMKHATIGGRICRVIKSQNWRKLTSDTQLMTDIAQLCVKRFRWNCHLL